jgi:hypothetical protein
LSETEDPTPQPGIRVLGQPSTTSAPEPNEMSGPGEELAPDGEPAPEGEESGRSVRPGVLLALVLVGLLGVIGTITFGLLWAHDQFQQSGTKSVESASRSVAQKFLTDFTTFGPSTVAKTFSDIQALSTGNFARQAKTEFSPSLRQQLQAAKASTQGQVRYLELQSSTANAATYFADVVQTVSNDKTSGPQSDELRLVVDLTKVRGQWKVSAVTSLDTPAASGGSASGG